MKFGGIGSSGNWSLGGALSPAAPKVSGWSQAGSILGLIGGVIAKTSKDKKTQSFGKALAAVGSIPGAIHKPKTTESIWNRDSPNNTDFSSLALNPNTQFNPIPGLNVNANIFDSIKQS